MQKKRRNPTLSLCMMGVLMAIYWVLAKMTIPLGNLHITLASLVIVVAVALLGTWRGTVVALMGEFLIQATGRYGLTVTTPLWCLPPAFRALVLGLGFALLGVRQPRGKRQIVLFYVVLMLGALVTTIGNTAVIWADSVIFGYYSYAYVFGQLVIRLVTGVVTAVVVGIIAIPLDRALEKSAGDLL